MQPAPQLEQPSSVGVEHRVLDAQPAQLAGDGRATRSLELGKPLPDLPAGGVDLQPSARLGVDECQATERRELALAPVTDLDRQD
jgi:hypothetical protein